MVTQVTPPPPTIADLSAARSSSGLSQAGAGVPAKGRANFGQALRTARVKHKAGNQNPTSEVGDSDKDKQPVSNKAPDADPKSEPRSDTPEPESDGSSVKTKLKDKHPAAHDSADQKVEEPPVDDGTAQQPAIPADTDESTDQTTQQKKSAADDSEAGKPAAPNPAVAAVPVVTVAAPPRVPSAEPAQAAPEQKQGAGKNGNAAKPVNAGPKVAANTANLQGAKSSQATPAPSGPAAAPAVADQPGAASAPSEDDAAPKGVGKAAKGKLPPRTAEAGAKNQIATDEAPDDASAPAPSAEADLIEADAQPADEVSSSAPADSNNQVAPSVQFNPSAIAPQQHLPATPASSTPAASPAQTFAEVNQTQIVGAITGQLMPNGGTMQITLHPANLGHMQITVHVTNGQVSATFETSTDQATRLLSHNLSQLKQTLESGGINVDKLQVQQSRDPQPQSSMQQQQQQQSGGGNQQSSQQQQQRQEILDRMWEKIANAQLTLDVKA